MDSEDRGSYLSPSKNLSRVPIYRRGFTENSNNPGWESYSSNRVPVSRFLQKDNHLQTLVNSGSKRKLSVHQNNFKFVLQDLKRADGKQIVFEDFEDLEKEYVDLITFNDLETFQQHLFEVCLFIVYHLAKVCIRLSLFKKIQLERLVLGQSIETAGIQTSSGADSRKLWKDFVDTHKNKKEGFLKRMAELKNRKGISPSHIDILQTPIFSLSEFQKKDLFVTLIREALSSCEIVAVWCSKNFSQTTFELNDPDRRLHDFICPDLLIGFEENSLFGYKISVGVNLQFQIPETEKENKNPNGNSGILGGGLKWKNIEIPTSEDTLDKFERHSKASHQAPRSFSMKQMRKVSIEDNSTVQSTKKGLESRDEPSNPSFNHWKAKRNYSPNRLKHFMSRPPSPSSESSNPSKLNFSSRALKFAASRGELETEKQDFQEPLKNSTCSKKSRLPEMKLKILGQLDTALKRMSVHDIILKTIIKE